MEDGSEEFDPLRAKTSALILVRAPVLKLSEGTPLQKHHELGEMSSRTEEIPHITGGSIIIFPSKQVKS
jgi:hypothetical protein